MDINKFKYYFKYYFGKIFLFPVYYYARYRRFPEEKPVSLINRNETLIRSAQFTSLYSNLLLDAEWSDLREYLSQNSNKITSYRQNPYRHIPLFAETAIGGFSEAIILNIATDLIYTAGKEVIIEILKRFKSANNEFNRINTSKDGEYIAPVFPEAAYITITFKDKKKVEISIPFNELFLDEIDKIEFTVIDKNFKKGYSQVYFNQTTKSYEPGSILDQYM